MSLSSFFSLRFISSSNRKTFSFSILFTLLLSLPAFAEPPFGGTIFINSDIITSEDPSTLTSLTETGTGTREGFDRRVDNFINFQAFLFQASFSDTPNVEIHVNMEFGSVEAARIEAQRYAFIVGQMPLPLKRDLDTITIHQGDVPFGGGNNNLLIHIGSAVSYITDGILEETVVHELSHTSLDLRYENNADWLSAQSSDPEFISTYARDNPNREDLAETFLLWMAQKYRADRIPADLVDTIETSVPARLAFFDALAFDMSPVAEASGNAPSGTGDTKPDFSSASSVTPNTPVFGSFNAGESIFYRIDAPAPGTFSITTSSDTDTFGTLYDENGEVLLLNDDGGEGNQFLLTLNVASGTYYVGINGFNENEAGTFTLNVGIEFNPEVTPEDLSSASSVTPNTPVFGSLTAGETIYYRLDIPAPATLSASTVSAVDTFGYLYDEEGTALLSDDDSGTENQFLLAYDAPAGTYFIGVRSFNNSDIGSFTLNVAVEFSDPEPSGLDFSSAESVTPNTPTPGSVSAAETVLYRLDMPLAGTVLVSTLSDIDTIGFLYDEDGTELLRDNDSGNTDQFGLEYEATAGTYFIGVGANSALVAGEFTLIVSVDFASTNRPETSLPQAEKIRIPGGLSRDVSMGVGAFTASGEVTFATDFIADDFITVLGEVLPDPGDIGKNGEIFVVVKSVVAGKLSLQMLNLFGLFQDWDLTLQGLDPAVLAAPLEETHSITIFEGNLQAGKHNIYLAYQVDGGPLIYTKAFKITVTE